MLIKDVSVGIVYKNRALCFVLLMEGQKALQQNFKERGSEGEEEGEEKDGSRLAEEDEGYGPFLFIL